MPPGAKLSVQKTHLRLPVLYRQGTRSGKFDKFRCLVIPPLSKSSPLNVGTPPREAALREAARQLEITFLAEMLKSAGAGQARDSFGGGAGEAQFNSFLIRQQAEALALGGGIGLAEQLFHALKEKDDAI